MGGEGAAQDESDVSRNMISLPNLMEDVEIEGTNPQCAILYYLSPIFTSRVPWEGFVGRMAEAGGGIRYRRLLSFARPCWKLTTPTRFRISR